MSPVEKAIEAVERDGGAYTILRDDQPAAVLAGFEEWRALQAAVHGGEGGS